ncbi:MAG: ABC transporter permease [Gammaproteobacteria bacterium]|nr:ABC transporter permease [Gammaproteobacteria bacterium]
MHAQDSSTGSLIAHTESPWRLFWQLLQRDRLAMAGLGILLALAVVALLGKATTEWLVIFDPTTVRLVDKFRAPLSEASALLPDADRPLTGVYLLGTDELGRDVFARMLQGSFVSMSIGFVAVGISIAVGVVLGGIAGYYGEVRIGPVTVDTLIMRFTDAMLCIPIFFLILVVVALLPASIYNIMIVIGLTRWMGISRFVRAEFLSLREQDFVLAARALGLPAYRIIFWHMMPNAMAPVLVTATIGVATAILTESALSFLGFGVQPPFATWGNILADGKNFIFDAPWLFFIPGFAIFVIVLAFNLLGEGMREALNPKLQRR